MSLFNVNELSHSQVKAILKDLRDYFQITGIKLNLNTDTLRSMLSDCLTLGNDHTILDYVLSKYLDDSKLTQDLYNTVSLLGSLPLTLAKLQDLGFNALSKPTEVKPDPVAKVTESKSKFLPYRKDQNLAAIGLINSFRSVGFKDQNGTVYRDDVAELVLSQLWDHTEFGPSGAIKTTGYFTPCRVWIKPETQAVESTDKDGLPTIINRPIYQVNPRTVIEANKVLRNSERNRVADKKFVLKPLFSGNDLLLENVGSVEWYSHDPSVNKLRDQDIKASRLRKSKVKTKITWGSKYYAIALDPSLSYGVSVPSPYQGSAKTDKFKIVLSQHGRILLLCNGKLSQDLGRWESNFDQKTNTLGIAYLWANNGDLKGIDPLWYQDLNAALDRLIKSQGRDVKSRLDLTLLARLAEDHANDYTKRLGSKRYKALKRQARSAVFSLYYYNPDPKLSPDLREPNPKSPLPYEIQRACEKLTTDKGLTEDQRARLNTVLVGYAVYKGLIGKGTKTEVNTRLNKSYVKPKY
jgi:hypothetical protein